MSHLQDVALALIGSGAFLALELKACEACKNPSLVQNLTPVNTFIAFVWWIALVAAVAFLVLPNGTVDAQNAAIASFFTSAFAALMAGTFLMCVVVDCKLIAIEDVEFVVWGCIRVTVVAALVAFMWRAWKEKVPKTNEKKE